MRTFQEIRRFGVEVVKHWATLVTGGVITALVLVIAKRRNVDFAPSVYLGLYAVFLVVAMFLAWRDQYREVQRLTSRRMRVALVDKRANENVWEARLRVTPAGSESIQDVGVRITSIDNISCSGASGMKLAEFSGLTLRLHGDRDVPPRRSVTIHAGMSEVFDLVTVQAHPPEIAVWHTAGLERATHPGLPRQWNSTPSPALPPGRYCMRLAIVGGAQAEPFTLTFGSQDGVLDIREG